MNKINYIGGFKMEYVKLGNSGLEVSKICLGCMGFGDPVNWQHKWVLKEEESRKVIKQALDMGINFFDTANVYSNGVSEEILGRALKDYANRDETVVATKVFFNSVKALSDEKKEPNSMGLSRKAIMTSIEKSLKRLQTDYIDLYIIHRWDYNTPIEETMEVLHDLVKSGKVRYIGASAMYAWQFQKAQYVAEKNSWTKFISMQNHYNLIYREDEREMIPLCKDQKVGLTPYSPLAGGKLTRELDEETLRKATDEVAKKKYGEYEEADKQIILRVKELAEKYDVEKSNIALAWLFSKNTVPIIGATKSSHLNAAINALGVKLTDEDIAYLEEMYIPHKIVGAL